MPAFINGPSYLFLPRDPTKWVIKHLIPVSGLTNVFGKPKAGKSFASLGMAIAISSGQPDWNGFAIEKHGPVAYLQIDTPRGEWADRISVISNAGHDLSNVHFCDMLMTPGYPFNILAEDQHTWLKNGLAELQPVVVFIDTIREAHGTDENDSTAMRNVVTQLVAAARPAAVVLISHSRKDTMFTATGGDDLMNDARGSSYISGRMDTVIKFTTNDKHATGMIYRGRSVGQGRLAVTQDETGLVVLDGAAETYAALLHDRVVAMRTENPKITINAMAEDIAHRTEFKKKRSIDSDIKKFLQTTGFAEGLANIDDAD